MEFDKMKFGYRLSDLLRERGISQCKAAADIGIQQGSLSNYVNGRVAPGAYMIVNFCRYFNVSADYLLGLTDLE